MAGHSNGSAPGGVPVNGAPREHKASWVWQRERRWGGGGRGSSNRCVYLNGVGSICQQVHYIAIGSVDGRPVVLLKEDATDILQTSIRNKRIHFIEFQHRIRDTDETEKGITQAGVSGDRNTPDLTTWCLK